MKSYNDLRKSWKNNEKGAASNFNLTNSLDGVILKKATNRKSM